MVFIYFIKLTISFWLAATCADIHGHHLDDGAGGRVHRLESLLRIAGKYLTSPSGICLGISQIFLNHKPLHGYPDLMLMKVFLFY